MEKSALDKLAGKIKLGNRIYHRFSSVLITFPLIGLGGYFGYITEIRDMLLLFLIAGVLYEIECLRCDVQYYGELWFRDLK